MVKKKNNKMKNKQIEGGPSKNEAAGEIVQGDVGVVRIDENVDVQGNETLEVVSNANRGGGEEIEIDRKVEVEAKQKSGGEVEIIRKAEVEAKQKSGGEVEIIRKADVGVNQESGGEVGDRKADGKTEVVVNHKCIGEVGDRKTEDKMEVELNEKPSGELGNRKAEVQAKQKSGGQVGDRKADDKTKVFVDQNFIGQVGDRKTEVEFNGKRSGEEQGSGKAEVEASEVRNLVEKNEGEGIGEVSEKRGGGAEVSMVTRKNKKKRSIGVEEVKRKKRKVKKEGEIVVEKQVGEASGMHDARVDQEKEMKGGVNDEHEVQVNDRMDVDDVEKTDLVQKDEKDGGGVQMLVQVTNQKEVAEATKVNKIKFLRGQISNQRTTRQMASRLMEDANQNKQEFAAIMEHEGQGVDLKLKGEVDLEKARTEKQEGQGAVLKKQTRKKIYQQKRIDRRQKQLEQKAHSHIDEDSRLKIVSVLNQFSISKDQEYTFDATLAKFERAAIHLLCRKMGMNAKSFGSGHRRCISVYKRKVSGKQTRKNNVTRFTLSEEAKDVSLNLFTRYPPYDCGSSDKMGGKFVGKTNRRRKIDPFFSRPLMSKLDIRRKVELLTSKLANDPKLKQITEKRNKLPIASFRDAITSAIDSHQVVLISGETGCGKTTQVSQYVLDHIWSKSETCKIICTQPRRISAVSVAGRIASERGENIGDSVGYKIKMESAGGRKSSIIFCTTGVLLRVLVTMGSNSLGKESSRTRNAIAGPDGITHIIVDEVHERDHFSDLLLAIVRDLLPSNPNIRLVLMSATIDAERFSQYFGGCPVIKVPGFTYPVKKFYLEDILSILKSNENNHLESASRSVTSENFLLSVEYRAVIDDTITLAWSSDEYEPLLDLVSAEAGLNIFNFQHSSTGVTPLMVFARKGRVGELCMALSLGADCYLQDNDGATALEWAKRENQKEAAEILKKHMENSVKNNEEEECLLDKYLATVNSELIDFVLVEKLLIKICTDSTDGAILVFLTGWDDIQKTITRLQRSSFFKDASKYLLLPLHSKVPSLDQKKVFERPSPGCRKIVLSTNIAESSITIDDVVYVINSGRMKEKSYDPDINVSTLLSSWISKASAKQRAGRAGRCQRGICYHLYSKTREASFSDFQVPEVKRMPLEELCLQVKILDPVGKIGEFLGKLLDPPVTQSITNAISVLQELGALSPDEELTELGNKLGFLPVHPVLSKMLFLAILLNCLDPALTLACISSYRDPFYQPMGLDEKKKAMSAKLELASLYGGHGDQLAVIAAFECWKIAQENGQGQSFCSRYFLSPATMKMLSRMRKKFLNELYRKGFIPEDGPCCSLNAHDPGIRNAVLLAGFYPKVGRLPLPKRGQRAVVETAGGVKVRLTSSSANYMLSLDDSEPLVIFDEIVRGDGGLLIKKCSVVGPLPLLLLAKEIIVTPYEEDEDNKGGIESDDSEVHKHKDSPKEEQTIMSSPNNEVKVVVDRWLTFESTALDVAQICCLRERLSAATLFKIRNPFGTQSKIYDASINSIARILSYDGLSGIPSTLKYKIHQTSETSATEASQSELEREKETSSPDFHLTSLLQQYHAKNHALHHGGEASTSTKRDNSDQPAHCNQQPPRFVEMRRRLPKWI